MEIERLTGVVFELRTELRDFKAKSRLDYQDLLDRYNQETEEYTLEKARLIKITSAEQHLN